MRKINTGDVFKLARLLKKGNVTQIVKRAYEEGRKKDADKEKIGMDVILEILCNCTDNEMERLIYGLISGICEKKPEDIESQSLETTIEDIKKIVRENNVINFWKAASGLAEMI